MRKCKWAWENKNYEDGNQISAGRHEKLSLAVESDPHDLNDGLRIDVKRVIGGSIVTFRSYDRTKDRSSSRTYIINDDADFERELGKCITLESMRNGT